MADINVTEEIIEINVTEEPIVIEAPSGAYPLPATVYSVFGRTGAVIAANGDYNTSLVTENTNLYFTNARARSAISLTTSGTSGAATYDSGTGVLNVPQYQGGVTSFNTRTGAISLTSADVSGALTYVPYNSSNPSGYITGITSGNVTTALGYTPVTNARTLTINGTTYDLTADRSWTIPTNSGTVTSVGFSAPTGFSVTGSPVTTNGTLALGFASGYSLPTNVKQGNWDDAYTFVAAFPTQTGNAGKYLTTDGSVLSWATNPLGTVTSVAMSVPTGLSVSGSPITSSGTLAVTFASGYSIPSDASQTTWDTAYTNRITSLTTTGSSGSATLISNTLNIPTYTLSGLGGQPALSGTGFVKISGTTISYDNSTYYLASNPSAFIALTALSAGTGISYNNTTGVITNSAPDQTVSLSNGTGISVSGTYPSFTIASTITQYTDALARASISLTTTGSSGAATYDNTTGVLNIPQYSGGGGGMAIGGSITSATAGSVLFAGASGVLAQDNANFFWDDTNNRLGLGTASPTARLQVTGSTTASSGFGLSTVINPTLVAAANNDKLIALDVTGTFTTGGFTGTSSLVARFNGNVIMGTIPSVISSFTYVPLTLSNSAFAATKVQLALVNGGGGGGAASAIDFFTYTDAGNGLPGVRIIAVDDGNYSGDYQIQTKAQGSVGAGALSTKFVIIGGSGNIGIGTTTVGSKLQVNGNAAIGYSASTAAPTNGLIVAGNSYVGKTTDDGTGAIFQVLGSVTAASFFSPSGTSQGTIARFQNSTNGGYVTIIGGGSSSGVGGWSNGNIIECVPFSTGNFVISSLSNSIVFMTGSRGQLSYINSAGNMGLATSTIGSKLQVNGNAAIGYSASTAAPTNGLAVSGVVGIGSNSVTNGTSFGGAGQINVLKLSSNNYTTLEINSTTTNGGSIQWTNGTNSPNTIRGLIGYNSGGDTVNEFAINNVANGALNFATNNTSRAYITAGGNMGVGTTTVGSKLQVNGNAAIGYSASTAAPTNGLAVAGEITAGGTTTWNAGRGLISAVNGTSDAPILSLKNTDATKQVYYASYNNLDKSLQYIVYGSTATGTILGQNRANAAVVLGYNTPSVLAIGNFESVPMVFGTNNLERFRITAGGNLLVNTSTDVASAILQVSSTTQGFLPPKMTTTQKNAITSPAAGLIVYDTTLNKLCVFTTTWETITSL